MSKNSKQLFKQSKFSIRKFSAGAASVVIGSVFLYGMADHNAEASEITQEDTIAHEQAVNAQGEKGAEVVDQTQPETQIQPQETQAQDNQLQEQPRAETPQVSEAPSVQEQPQAETQKQSAQPEVKEQPAPQIQTLEAHVTKEKEQSVQPDVQEVPKVVEAPKEKVTQPKTQKQPKAENKEQLQTLEAPVSQPETQKVSAAQNKEANATQKAPEPKVEVESNVAYNETSSQQNVCEVPTNAQETNSISYAKDEHSYELANESQFKNPKQLDSSAFEVTKLEGKEVQPANKYTQPSYQVDMTIKLKDGQVKAGDVLQFGTFTDIKLANGKNYRDFDTIRDDNKISTQDLMFEGKKIGTLVTGSNLYSDNNKAIRIDNVKYMTDYADPSDHLAKDYNSDPDKYGSAGFRFINPPYSIIFDKEVENLKNVVIDTTYHLSTARPIEIYEKDKNQYGDTFDFKNELYVNGNLYNLNRPHELKTIDDSTYKHSRVIGDPDKTIGERGQSSGTILAYYDTPKGEFMIPVSSFHKYSLGATFNTVESNNITSSITVPKEVLKYITVSENSNFRNNAPATSYETLTTPSHKFLQDDKLISIAKRTIKNENTNWDYQFDKKENEDGSVTYTAKYTTKNGEPAKILGNNSISSYDFNPFYFTVNDPQLVGGPVSYDEANKRPYNQKWALEGLTEALAKNPISINVKTDENNITDQKIDKLPYAISRITVKEPPKNAIRVVASDEREEIVPKEEKLNYKSSIRYNKDLPKGERVVIKEGKNGKATYELQNIYKGDKLVYTSDKLDYKIVEQPDDEIIEVGTGVVGTDIQNKTEAIPFETQEVEDESLPKGETKIVQKGENGEKTITTTTPTLNNKPSGEPVVEEVVNKLPTTQIIHVGTGVVDKQVDTRTETIEFKTIEEENKDLPQGERKVVQKGENGEKTITTTTPTLNGKPSGEPKVEEKVTKEPIDEIVQVGTGVVSEKVETQKEPIEFEIEERENPDLPKGETRIVQQGENGEKEIISTTPTLNDKPNGETKVEEKIIKEPINQIVEVGTGVVGEQVDTRTETIKFEIEERENKDLPQGETRIIQQGVDGEKEITTTTPTLNDKPNGEPKIEEKVTKDPINQIVEVGTGVISEKVETQKEPIDFEVEEIKDKSIPQGETKVEREGQQGEKTITTTIPTLNDKPNGEPKVEEKVTKEPVSKIIRVGTGVASEKVENKTESIPFETIYKENLDMLKGEQKVTQEGENGEKIITSKTPTFNGEISGETVVTEEVTKQPVNRIIEVGAGELEIREEVVKTENTPHDKKIIENPDLPKGETRVVQQGKDGVTKTISKQSFLNGKPYGEPEITVVVESEPVDEIIEQGTKEIIEEPSQPEKHEEPSQPEQPEQPREPEKPEDPSQPEQPSVEQPQVQQQESTKDNQFAIAPISQNAKVEVENLGVSGPKAIAQQPEVMTLNSQPKVEAHKEQTQSKDDVKELPNTGESSSEKLITVFVGVGLLLAGIALIRSNRRKNNTN